MHLEILAEPLMDPIHVHILFWLHYFWELNQILQLVLAAKTCLCVMAAPWGGCCNICKAFFPLLNHVWWAGWIDWVFTTTLSISGISPFKCPPFEWHSKYLTSAVPSRRSCYHQKEINGASDVWIKYFTRGEKGFTLIYDNALHCWKKNPDARILPLIEVHQLLIPVSYCRRFP